MSSVVFTSILRRINTETMSEGGSTTRLRNGLWQARKPMPFRKPWSLLRVVCRAGWMEAVAEYELGVATGLARIAGLSEVARSLDRLSAHFLRDSDEPRLRRLLFAAPAQSQSLGWKPSYGIPNHNAHTRFRRAMAARFDPRIKTALERADHARDDASRYRFRREARDWRIGQIKSSGLDPTHTEMQSGQTVGVILDYLAHKPETLFDPTGAEGLSRELFDRTSRPLTARVIYEFLREYPDETSVDGRVAWRYWKLIRDEVVEDSPRLFLEERRWIEDPGPSMNNLPRFDAADLPSAQSVFEQAMRDVSWTPPDALFPQVRVRANALRDAIGYRFDARLRAVDRRIIEADDPEEVRRLERQRLVFELGKRRAIGQGPSWRADIVRAKVLSLLLDDPSAVLGDATPQKLTINHLKDFIEGPVAARKRLLQTLTGDELWPLVREHSLHRFE